MRQGCDAAAHPEVQLKVEGQCYCGAIAFEAEVRPGTVTICHCADCQVQSGTAFRANIPAPAAGFRLLRGAPRTFVKVAASGNRRVLAFCEACGTQLYACAEHDPPSYSLRTGTLKQRDELGVPQRQIWTRRRLPWLAFTQEIPCSDGQP